MRGIARWLVFGVVAVTLGLVGAFAVSGVAVANPAPACFNGYVQPPGTNWCVPAGSAGTTSGTPTSTQ